MKKKKGQPYMPVKAKKDNWGTPPSIFDPLNKEFKFTLDAAADDKNHLCKKYYTKEDDGTTQPWKGHTVWCNPPYDVDNLIRFTGKAIYEAITNHVTSVFLVPAKTDQAWFHELWDRNGKDITVEFRWVRGRVKFVGAIHTATISSIVIVIRPHIGTKRGKIVKND